jgi:hypothetical protein
MLDGIDIEWAAISHTSPGRRAANRWTPFLTAAGFDYDPLDALVSLIRHPGDHQRSDIVVRVLLDAAHAGDELAARTLIQGLLPFVGRLAARYARGGVASFDDAAGEILAAVQQRITATHPRADQAMLVAYLQLTVRRQMRRSGPQRLFQRRPETSLDSGRYDESCAPIELLSAPSERDAAGHVATIVRHGLRTGVLSRDEAELLLLIAAGHPAAVIARQLGRDPSVIIRRLHKATRAAGRIAA